MWQSGSNVVNQLGQYVSYEPVGVPGARYGSLSWVDPKHEDTFWMFGGIGYGASSSIYLNDLWRYRKEEGWVWIDGHSTQVYGVYTGAVKYPGGRQLSVGWTDKEGSLWLFG